MTDKIIIEVNGKEYSSWTHARITTSIGQAARTFILTTDDNTERPDIKAGAPCTVSLKTEQGNIKIVTGHIDKRQTRYSKKRHSLIIAGRSRTADLVDSGIKPPWTEYSDASIEEIANTMAEPYGIDIITDIPTDIGRTTDYAPTPGQCVIEAIEEIARDSGLFITDNADGQLVIADGTRWETQDGQLNSGREIISATITHDNEEQYRTTEVRGQSDNITGAITTDLLAAVENPTIRERNIYIFNEKRGNQESIENRARWEVNSRNAKARTAIYTVQGWKRNDTAVWEPKIKMIINDTIGNVNEDMVTVTVQHELSPENGFTTTMIMVPKNSYVLYWELQEIQ